jgi:DNA-binding MarR family transcriptional regulator
MLRETGLRITQVALLAQVRMLQPVTVTGLASALGSERSAVARDLAILERDGLVSITAMPSDLRAREVRLTPSGERRLTAAAPAWRAAQRQMAARLGAKDLDQLVRLSCALVAVLAEPGREERSATGRRTQAHTRNSAVRRPSCQLP